MPALHQPFAALGDDTRRAILAQLKSGELPVSELAKQHDLTLTGASNHIRVLEGAGLLTVEKRGRTRHCRINPTALRDAADWLAGYRDFWADQLENMAHVLKDMDDG